MSKYTEKIVAQISEETQARLIVVALMGCHADIGDKQWTVRAHPLLDRSLPDYLRAMADSVEKQQKAK